MRQPAVQYVTIHGHRRAFVKVGSGPALLLLHGLGCDHTTWLPVLDSLARRYTVIAPDLLGHGDSDKPRADYSVGGFANGMRDLLTVLGIDRATVVGHSFGGGVAMQFAYQFPERTERLVLVGSGGLGPEVSAAIRAITTTGFYQVMGLLTLPGVRHLGTGRAAGPVAHRAQGVPRLRRGGLDLPVVPRPGRPRCDPARRARGGRLAGPDRDHGRPGLPHRGDADVRDLGRRGPRDPDQPCRSVPPSWHRRRGSRSCPTSGHFPHKDHPDLFVKVLHDFVHTTRPASYSRARWRRLLAAGRPRRPVPLAAVPTAPERPTGIPRTGTVLSLV